MHASDGPQGGLAVHVLAALATGVVMRQSMRPPAAALNAIVPRAEPERPFERLTALMQVMPLPASLDPWHTSRVQHTGKV